MIVAKPVLPQESFVKLANWRNGDRSRWNVYLLKIGAKFFRNGSQDICKDTESNLGPFAGFYGWNYPKASFIFVSVRSVRWIISGSLICLLCFFFWLRMSIKGNWRRHGSEVVIRWCLRYFARRFATGLRGFAAKFCHLQREKKLLAPRVKPVMFFVWDSNYQNMTNNMHNFHNSSKCFYLI